MAEITASLGDGMTDEQHEKVGRLKRSTAWGLVQNMAADIIENECNPDGVDEKLPSDEFKAEALARRKAKAMFTKIFDEVRGVATFVEKKKVDYS